MWYDLPKSSNNRGEAIAEGSKIEYGSDTIVMIDNHVVTEEDMVVVGTNVGAYSLIATTFLWR